MLFKKLFITLGLVVCGYTEAFGFSDTIEYKKADLAFSYITQYTKGETYTLIPYWAPQMPVKEGVVVGARLGGTVVKDNDNKRIFAFEGDLHADFKMQWLNQEFELQPLVGLKSWDKMGTAVSGGMNVLFKVNDLQHKIFAGAQFWSKSDRNYGQYSAGVSYEF